MAFPCGSVHKVCLQWGRPGFNPWVGKIRWRREQLPTPVFWPGEFHGLCNPWCRKQSDTTESLSLWASLVAQKIPEISRPGKSHGRRSLVGCSPWVAKSRTRLSDFTFTFHFHALEKEMATHSSVLAWRIPGMGEPGGLPSIGSHRVGHDWSDLAVAVAQRVKHLLACRRPRFDPWARKIPCRRKWQSTPVFLPGEFHGLRSLAGYSPWGCRELDMTEWLTHTLLKIFPM